MPLQTEPSSGIRLAINPQWTGEVCAAIAHCPLSTTSFLFVVCIHRGVQAVQGNDFVLYPNSSRVLIAQQGVCIPTGYRQLGVTIMNHLLYFETCFRSTPRMEVTCNLQHTEGPTWHIILTGNLYWIHKRLQHMEFNQLCCIVLHQNIHASYLTQLIK